MISSDEIRIDTDGDISVVTLARPSRRNALSSELARSVAEALDEGGRRSRVVILTGEGDAFCAGGDLEELDRWSHLDPDEIGSVLYASFQQMIRTIRSSPAIVIAAVNGAAVGAGMDLALACDLRVASETARFGQIWVRLGVIPGTGGAFLTQMVAGTGRASEMLLTGDLISAADAHTAGLVNKVVPHEQLMEEARAMAERVLRHPHQGVIANKQAIVAATDAQMEAALQHAAEVQPGRFTSDEFRAAVRKALS
ncbi:MAG: enoyl-CoA hydratase/isomerase family protein [Actinomycetota bacterium]